MTRKEEQYLEPREVPGCAVSPRHSPQRIPGRSGTQAPAGERVHTEDTLARVPSIFLWGPAPVLPTQLQQRPRPTRQVSSKGRALGSGRVVTVWLSPLHSSDGGLAGVRDRAGSLLGQQPPPPPGSQLWKPRSTQADRRPQSERATRARRGVERSHPRVAKSAFAGHKMRRAGYRPGSRSETGFRAEPQDGTSLTAGGSSSREAGRPRASRSVKLPPRTSLCVRRPVATPLGPRFSASSVPQARSWSTELLLCFADRPDPALPRGLGPRLPVLQLLGCKFQVLSPRLGCRVAPS